jgi:hypothetical protein
LMQAYSGALGSVDSEAMCVESGNLDDGKHHRRDSSYLVRSSRDFHLDKLNELGVIDLIALVQGKRSLRARRPGEQAEMWLAGSSHRTVGCSDNENSTVHLSRPGDHVFDIVGVARAVQRELVTASV